MGAFFAAMRAEIEAEGGTVEKFIGDAVMAAFGVPRVHEDDPARALRAALRMRAGWPSSTRADREPRRRARAADRDQHRRGDGDHLARGRRGARDRRRRQRGGAARAGGRARGRCWSRERTAQAARGFRLRREARSRCAARRSRCTRVELVAEQPSPRDAVGHARAARRPRRASSSCSTQPTRRVVAEGAPHLVTLYGEAGVGKSRLVGELLAARGAAPTPRVVRGRCLPTATASPTGRSPRSLKARARRARHRRRRRRRWRRSRGLGRRRGRRLAAHASAWLDREHRPAARQPAAGGARRDAARLARVLLALARRPDVVVIEDMHWADAAVLELLEDVAPDRRRARCCSSARRGPS